VLRNDAEAEDVTQATFMAALRGLSSLNAPDRFTAWLCGIALRLARKSLRRSADDARRRALAGNRRTSFPEASMNEGDPEAVFRAVDQLPDDVRLPILLHHCDGLSYDEIAGMLDMPRGTVGTNIHRGLDRLRSAIPGTVALGALLAAAGSANASSVIVEAVSRLALTAPLPTPAWPLKLKASLAVATGAAALFIVAAAARPETLPPPSVPPAFRTAGAFHAASAPAPAATAAISTPLPSATAPTPAADPREETIFRNEQKATACLKVLSMSEVDFRANDRDWNHINDFWTADVSGLYRVKPAMDPAQEIKLIPRGVASADAAPLGPLGNLGPPLSQKPSDGYWFRMLPVASASEGRSTSEFTIAAYPAEYGISGRRTIIISESNVSFSKDLAGACPSAWPSDDALLQWEKEPPPAPKAATQSSTPEELVRARTQGARLGFGCDLNRPVWDLRSHTLTPLQDILKLDAARWTAFRTTRDQILERAKRLESDRAQSRIEGEKMIIEIPPFPQEGMEIIREWNRALESLLSPEQKRDLDTMYAYYVFPLGLGQLPVRITREKVGEQVRLEERVILPSGEALWTGSHVDAEASPRYRHLLR
jgi:RNA polymerase sigma-70 factor (ECF subfamily)